MTRNEIASYIGDLEKLFRAHGKPERAAGAKAYMRNLFDYYGISTPDRRTLQKQFHASHALPAFSDTEKIVRMLWKKDQRELQYFAMELCYPHRKKFPREALALFEYMIRNKSWWDTVDFISIKLVAAYFSLYPESVEKKTAAWISSGHIWLMRTAISFQNGLKEKTNERLLFRMIRISTGHEDFFIRKAIGWALRSYAYTNPDAVRKFVKRTKMSPLSEREAMKHL